MNPLGELLAADDIRLDLDVSTKTQLLDEIAALLAARQGLPKSVVFESLKAREQLGSTAVGHGVAIPHARMSQCAGVAVAFVRTKVPIPFDAPDGRPVSVFVGLIVPNQANERHLRLLATAAGMLDDRNFRNLLRTVASPTTARELLESWPDAPASGLE
jgi:nitrogen PTS system EIIA component